MVSWKHDSTVYPKVGQDRGLQKQTSLLDKLKTTLVEEHGPCTYPEIAFNSWNYKEVMTKDIAWEINFGLRKLKWFKISDFIESDMIKISYKDVPHNCALYFLTEDKIMSVVSFSEKKNQKSRQLFVTNVVFTVNFPVVFSLPLKNCSKISRKRVIWKCAFFPSVEVISYRSLTVHFLANFSGHILSYDKL